MAVEGVTVHFSIQVLGNRERWNEISRELERLFELICKQPGVSLVKVDKSPFKISDLRDKGK